MFIARRTFQKSLISYMPFTRFINSPANDILSFKPKFSDEEQMKILNIINEENTEQLLKFSLTRGRIKNLEVWRMKNGPFRTLSDVLEVEGLGEKVLEIFCNSIILNKINDNHLKLSQGNRKQFVTPVLPPDVLDELETAVAIHTSHSGVSWAKLKKENNEIVEWSFQDFSFLPKKTPTETYDLAVEILRKLPDANVYVLEATPSMSPQNPQARKFVPTYNQQMELASMLLALINSSPKHGRIESVENDSIVGGEYNISHNKVYFLRAFLSARLFKTLVGNERVSSAAIMSKLLDNASDLPCTAIKTTGPIKSNFFEQTSFHKDLLGQAMMLIVSFMDICVYNNSISLESVNRGRRN